MRKDIAFSILTVQRAHTNIHMYICVYGLFFIHILLELYIYMYSCTIKRPGIIYRVLCRNVHNSTIISNKSFLNTTRIRNIHIRILLIQVHHSHAIYIPVFPYSYHLLGLGRIRWSGSEMIVVVIVVVETPPFPRAPRKSWEL